MVMRRSVARKQTHYTTKGVSRLRGQMSIWKHVLWQGLNMCDRFFPWKNPYCKYMSLDYGSYYKISTIYFVIVYRLFYSKGNISIFEHYELNILTQNKIMFRKNLSHVISTILVWPVDHNTQTFFHRPPL